MAAPLPALWRAYAGGTAVLAPALSAWDRRTLTRKGAPVGRLPERRGLSSRDRPEGELIWLHGVSIGEMRVAQSVAAAVQALRPDVHALITSASATSASAAVAPGMIHQMAPLDTPRPVARFLRQWQPSLAVFTESDLWPRQIVRCHQAGVPLALINARLSPKSIERWRSQPGLAEALFSRFSLVAAQTRATAVALDGLGAPTPIVTGDLKRAAAPLPVDAGQLRSLREMLGDGPLWVAASTHPGEDEPILRAHRYVLGRVPEARLILVPRHPHRGPDLIEMAEGMELTATLRSQGGAEDAQVYVADTVGELGLWFDLAQAVVMGGSFEPIGGHNPMEPAHTATPILSGPHVDNFNDIYPPLVTAGAAEMIEADDIGAKVIHLLTQEDEARQMGACALRFAQSEGHGVQQVALELVSLMNQSNTAD